MKKLAFITGTRADFGKLKPLLLAAENSGDFAVHIFCTGMHLLDKFGKTIDEVFKCGFKNIFPFFNHFDYDAMDVILAKTIDGFSAYIKDLKPDMILAHGDRVETLAATITGNLNNVLTGHIEGGDCTGSCDENLRHSSTKMAHLHFVSNEQAKNRLIQMGENKDHIFVIGSPSLDIMLGNDLPDLETVKQHYEIPFDNYAILIYHPVVTEFQQAEDHAKQLVNAILSSGKNYIVIHPTNDLGTDFIMSAYGWFKNNPKIKMFPSMRFEYFQTLLKNAEFIIGNSSSGIIEAPYYGTPTINIGTRQAGRLANDKIIHCSNNSNQILKAINNLQPRNPETEKQLYGSGNSAEQFLKVLQNPATWTINKQKQFIDLI